MLLGHEYDYCDTDLLEYIVFWINEIEKASKDSKSIHSSESKMDYVLNNLQQLLTPHEYAKHEKFLIIVIHGLVQMGNGKFKVKTKLKSNCCSIL